MNLVIILVLLAQSAIQSAFLAVYLKNDHPWRLFWIFMAVFLLFLYPINALLLPANTILRNLFNMAVLFLTYRILFRSLSWVQLLEPVVLYEVCLVLSELFMEYFGNMIDRTVYVFPPTDPGGLTVMYIWGTLTMPLTFLAALRLFSKAFTSSMVLNAFLLTLFLNIILSGMCCFIAIAPYLVTSFRLDYVSVWILLTALNSATLIALLLTSRKESQKEALARIQETYSKQVDEYLQNEKEEEKLAHLRHDLKNFLAQSGLQKEPGSVPAEKSVSADSADFMETTIVKMDRPEKETVEQVLKKD